MPLIYKANNVLLFVSKNKPVIIPFSVFCLPTYNYVNYNQQINASTPLEMLLSYSKYSNA